MKRDIQTDRKLCEQATPGPWMPLLIPNTSRLADELPVDEIPCACCGEDAIGNRYYVTSKTFEQEKIEEETLYNTRFITEARQALPHYIDRAEKAEKRVAELEIERDELETQLTKAEAEYDSALNLITEIDIASGGKGDVEYIRCLVEEFYRNAKGGQL